MIVCPTRLKLPGNRYRGWTSTLSKHRGRLRFGPRHLWVSCHTYKNTARKLHTEVSLKKKRSLDGLKRPTHLAITPQIDEPNEVGQRRYPIGHVVDLRSLERSRSRIPMRTRVGRFTRPGHLLVIHDGFPFISLRDGYLAKGGASAFLSVLAQFLR